MKYGLKLTKACVDEVKKPVLCISPKNEELSKLLQSTRWSGNGSWMTEVNSMEGCIKRKSVRIFAKTCSCTGVPLESILSIEKDQSVE